MTYDFTLIYRHCSPLSATQVIDLHAIERLYEVGCSDATISIIAGVARLSFDRESSSLGQAIGSAVDDVERAEMGLELERIEVEEDRSRGM